MTLAEIEDTLKNLQSRHPGLDEALLVTLLRAGGWEEKQIQDAIALYKGGSPQRQREGMQAAFPALEENMILPSQIDGDHLLVSGGRKEEPSAAEGKSEEKINIAEPQSLNPIVSASKREELPHDLPLRPFETSDHIWPFSRYKDVFYGDLPETEEIKASALKPAQPPAPPDIPEPPAPIPPAPKEAVPPEAKPAAPSFIREGPKISPKATVPANVSGQSEDKLVIIACAMLVAILFVLGYMYGNGRL
jgi:hypothetical protein